MHRIFLLVMGLEQKPEDMKNQIILKYFNLVYSIQYTKRRFRKLQQKMRGGTHKFRREWALKALAEPCISSPSCQSSIRASTRSERAVAFSRSFC
jgi:hypothetical protein